MKKEEQIRINRYVLESLSKFRKKSADAYENYDNVRLHHCTAYVYETDDYYVLRSYNIVVAFIDKENGDFVNFFRLVCADELNNNEYKGATTTQHIWKFRRDYQESVNNVFNYQIV